MVFVDETGPKERRVKRLAIMDQDGANVRYLTRGDDLVLTPRFSPSTQEITYMSFGQGDPRVYLLNIETGQREMVGNFPGMTFAPRFSPDGQRVIMSLQQGGNSNLFVMDLRSKATTRLTDTPAIDTAPSYSPDGTRICFESDRGGTQQIYVWRRAAARRSASASARAAIRRRCGRRAATTSPSPRQARGKFAIGIMKPDGSGERILTEGYHNEGPTFAPNGRVLMFFRDPAARGPSLFTVDITGRNERRCRRRALPRTRPGRRCCLNRPPPRWHALPPADLLRSTAPSPGAGRKRCQLDQQLIVPIGTLNPSAGFHYRFATARVPGRCVRVRAFPYGSGATAAPG